jgi:DNA-binding response OmpR family regulator
MPRDRHPGLDHALVVDDEPAMAAMLAVYLRRQGMAVDVACSFADALQRLEQQPFDLLITDLQLGRRGLGEGFELARHARGLRPRLLIILVSGTAPPDIESLARQHGIDLFLPKPIDLAKLRDLVRELLPGGIARRAVDRPLY